MMKAKEIWEQLVKIRRIHVEGQIWDPERRMLGDGWRREDDPTLRAIAVASRLERLMVDVYGDIPEDERG